MGALTEYRLATPNYSYEKRQRELAKKRKNEEKKQRKAQRGNEPSSEADDPAGGAGAADGSVAGMVTPQSAR